jgi:hypothetical protein
MIDSSEKTWFVAAQYDCGGLVEAQYFHHAAWYLDLIAAGGKFKGEQSQSKPFSTKDVVDNRRLKPILVCCLFRIRYFANYRLSLPHLMGVPMPDYAGHRVHG